MRAWVEVVAASPPSPMACSTAFPSASRTSSRPADSPPSTARRSTKAARASATPTWSATCAAPAPCCSARRGPPPSPPSIPLRRAIRTCPATLPAAVPRARPPPSPPAWSHSRSARQTLGSRAPPRVLLRRLRLQAQLRPAPLRRRACRLRPRSTRWASSPRPPPIWTNSGRAASAAASTPTCIAPPAMRVPASDAMQRALAAAVGAPARRGCRHRRNRSARRLGPTAVPPRAPSINTKAPVRSARATRSSASASARKLAALVRDGLATPAGRIRRRPRPRGADARRGLLACSGTTPRS